MNLLFLLLERKYICLWLLISSYADTHTFHVAYIRTYVPLFFSCAVTSPNLCPHGNILLFSLFPPRPNASLYSSLPPSPRSHLCTRLLPSVRLFFSWFLVWWTAGNFSTGRARGLFATFSVVVRGKFCANYVCCCVVSYSTRALRRRRAPR